MRLVLLGSTGYHPSETRHTACIFLPALGVALDAGTGFFRVRDWVTEPELDIFLSHAHLDHVVGLSFLFDVMHERPINRVRVFGEPEKLAAVQEHMFHPLLFPIQPPCEFHPLPREFELRDGGKLHSFPLVHPGGSLGFCLEVQGRRMAYVTDTTASLTADYLEHIRGVDLLVHECYFPDGWEKWAEHTGHSCTTPTAQVAAAVGAKRLVLVHLNPLGPDRDPIDVEAARAIFPATELGTDGMVLEF